VCVCVCVCARVDTHPVDANLLGKQEVLTRLWHLPVVATHDEDGAVHLRSTGDHVLHVVGVTRAVDVRVVPLGRLVPAFTM
jgi:hypothetical protein